MATNRPILDLSALVGGLLQDLRVVARPPAERGEEEPTHAGEQIEIVREHVLGQREQSVIQVNERYRDRTQAMQAVLSERQVRLEAYAGRQRQAVPTSPGAFVVAGRITDTSTGAGLPNVRVRATDLDRRTHDVLGEVRTDALGYYRLEYRAEDFAERDRNPETFIEVLDDGGEVIFRSTRSFVEKAGKSVFIPGAVDGGRLPDSRRIAEKVTGTVARRQEEFARRNRVMEHRPDVTLEVAGGRGTVVRDLTRRTVEARRAAPSAERRAVEPVAELRRSEPRERPAAPGRKQDVGARVEVPLTAVKGVGPAFGERFERAGIDDADAVARLDPSRVAEILNVGEARAKKIVAEAKRATRTGRSRRE